MVERVDQPGPDQLAEVQALVAAVGTADGVDPLAEDAVLRLRSGTGPTAHLLARDSAGQLTGYAQLDLREPATEVVGEVLVHPAARGRGLGRALVRAAQQVVNAAGAESGAGPARLRLWAHGDHPAAAALATSLGFRRVRELWQLRRPLSDPLPAPKLPDDFTLRSFRPGQDEQSWLAVNSRAFADHPEQGRWTPEDLRARLAEPWFDPAGLLLAERHRQVLGFCWIKVHSPETGEVYVVAVDPAAHGTGLGTALTLAGLRYLQRRGGRQVMLYVDESNTAARRLYRKLGFRRWSVDAAYLSP